MSSSLARARSLRKPTQGSKTDLTSSSSTSASATSSTTAAPQRNVSPSRLPAPRPTRPATRAVSSGSLNDAAGAAAAAKKKPSPLSNLLSRTSSTRQAARKDASSSSTSNGPSSAPLARSTASSLSRTSSTRDPAAGLNRLRNPAASSTSNLASTSTSTSSSRPTTSSGLAQKRTTTAGGGAGGSSDPVRGHTRARSVATLNGSTTLRPPSQSSSTTSAAPRPRPTSMYGAPTTSSTTAAAPSHLSSKPSISSLSSRTRASSTASKTQAPARPPARQQTTPTSPPRTKAPPPPKPVAVTRQQQQASPTSPPRNKPLLKPAFSTLQQHYSPAKNLAPKPLTATYLAPPSPSKLPTNVALSAETSRLQTELLQLHLLHRELPSVTSQWHASARQKLSARHAELSKSSKELSALEADAAERINVAALHRWASSSSSSDRRTRGALEEKIQRLDALLTALWSLDSPGGKHNRLVRAFERWASSLSELEAARARADDDADPSGLLDSNLEVRFGGGLDARWKDDCSALVRRLEGWETQLRDLAYHEEDAEGNEEGIEAPASSLKRMLDGCGSLVKDMLGELAVMEEIEAAAVERETEWIRKMNRRGDDGKRDTPRAGAVWRTI